VLMLHGLDVDIATGIVEVFPPSKVDLIKLRRSFVSIDVSVSQKEGMKNKIEIIDSSIGMSVALDAGVKIVRSSVRPLVHVKENIYDDRASKPDDNPSWKGMARDTFYLLEMAAAIWTFIPLYEVIVALPSSSFHAQILVIMLGILIQCTIWTLFLRVLQFIVHSLRSTSVHIPLLHSFFTYEWSCARWGLWFLLWGTPFFGTLLRFFGANIEGQMLFYGFMVQDLHRLSFADKTIVDNSLVVGHHQVYSVMTLCPTRVGGVIHNGSRLLGGASLEGNNEEEYGPFKFSAASSITAVGGV